MQCIVMQLMRVVHELELQVELKQLVFEREQISQSMGSLLIRNLGYSFAFRCPPKAILMEAICMRRTWF